MAGICDVDARKWHDPNTPAPMIFGHENVGRIWKAGKDARTDAMGQRLQEGDLVVFGGIIPCGKCYTCEVLEEPTSCENGVRYGGSPITESPYLRGGYGEYVHLVSSSGLVKIPDGMKLDIPLLAIAGHKALEAGIERMGGITPRDAVVIQGTLPHSLAAVTQARIHGAKKIIIVGPSKSRLKVAKELGADTTIEADFGKSNEGAKQVLDQMDGHGADIVIDTSGSPHAIDEGFNMLRSGGKYLVMGQATDYGTTPVHTTPIMRKQLRIFGSFSGLPRHVHQAMLELERAKVPVEKLITHRFRLEKATEGLMSVDRFESVFAVLEY